MSHFNLFSCHKYLECVSVDILLQLAKVSYTDKKTLDVIITDIENFQAMLSAHATWEEQFVFKYLAEEMTKAEVQHHRQLESILQSILQKLKSSNIAQSKSLHHIYLGFRKFHSDLLLHLYDEETKIMSKLCKKLSDQQLRQIDQEIYSQMSAQDMVDMVSKLFPPCNLEERLAVIEDLQRVNAIEFEKAESELIKYLRQA